MSQVDGVGQSTSSVNAAAFVRTESSVQKRFICPISGSGMDFLNACLSFSANLQWGSKSRCALSSIILSYPVNCQSFCAAFSGSPLACSLSGSRLWDADLELKARFLVSCL